MRRTLAGEFYNPLDPQLSAERHRCRDRCQRLNATCEDDAKERRRIYTATHLLSAVESAGHPCRIIRALET